MRMGVCGDHRGRLSWADILWEDDGTEPVAVAPDGWEAVALAPAKMATASHS